MLVEIEVPVLLWANVGRLKPKHWLLSVPRRFEIPEYASDEHPVALAYETRFEGRNATRREFIGIEGALYADGGFTADSEEGRALHYRHLADSDPVHPFFRGVQREIKRAIDRRRRAAHADRHTPEAHFPKELEESLETMSTYRVQRLSDVDMKDYHEQSVVDQVAAFAERMKRVVMVDGRAFVSEQEPLIAVSAAQRVGSALVRRREPKSIKELNEVSHRALKTLSYLSLFDIERLDDSMGRYSERLGIERDVSGDGVAAETIRVVCADSAYSKVSSEAATMLNVAEGLAKSFATPLLPGYHIKGSELQSADLRRNLDKVAPREFSAFRTLSAVDDTGEATVDPALEAAVEDVVAFLAETGTTSFGSEKVVAVAEIALADWQNRTIEFSAVSARPGLAR